LLTLLLTAMLFLSACGGGGLAQQPGGGAVAPGAPEGQSAPPAGASASPAGQGAAAASQGDAAGAQCKNEVLIGASLPLTGKEARVGGFYKEGYEAAVKQWNDKGGIDVGGQKKQIRLTLLDSQTNPTTSVSQYERLVTQDGVDFLLGSYSTLLVSADNIVAERYKIPYVNGGGAASEIYGKDNKYLFGTLSSVQNLAKTQMDWLKEMQDAGKLTAKPAKIALIWENTDHGKDFQKGVQEYAKANPDRFQVVIDESFELGGQDFSSLLRKVKSADADLFMADAHLEDFILMHRQYLEQGLHHDMVTYGARGSEKDAKEQLGNEAVAGVVSATWWSPELPYPQVKEFVDYWKSTHDGNTPAWYHALSYEAANTLFNAIQKAGTCDREKVRETLEQYDEPSILPGNRTYFTETGQIDNPFVIVQNTPEGKSVLIYPKDVATGEAIIPIAKR
jgi:branched-chain amino acid transport system substrate-binding protein